MNRLPSYASGTSRTPLLGMTLGQSLRGAVQTYRDREALVAVSQGVRLTYQELWDQTTAVALGLLAMGVQKGDRVGLWSPNRYEWVVVQFALARLGAILVNLNPAYKSSELEYALKQSGTSVLIHARSFRQTSYGPILQSIRETCPELRLALVLDDDWAMVMEAGRRASSAVLDEREAGLDFDEPINIQYTSGTTGFPKGATLSHHNVLNNGYFVGEALRLTENDRVAVPVPFYHCFGMVMGTLACMTHGATMVIGGEAFDAKVCLEMVARERCTALYGVPTMFIAALEHPEFETYDLSSLRTGIMAGAPCPVEVMRQVIERMHMKEVTIAYGMTETSPVSTQTEHDAPLAKRVGTVGKVHPHVEVKIVDPESHKIVHRGQVGELCTRGYGVMLEYWNDEAATRAAIDAAGWMHTGDLAVMDEEGDVRIVGRIKDMIIRGGENIYPREVEEFLHGHPGVCEVHVVGVPSEKYGEEVMAWVRLQDDAALDAEALRDFCLGKIATYKVPTHWRFVSEFPMTVTGKVQKYKMREMAAKEMGRVVK